MVSEREVKRIIAGCIPDRQFKAEAREAIARRTQEFMEEFIKRFGERCSRHKILLISPILQSS